VLAAVFTFAVVVVIVGVIAADSTDGPVLSGLAAAALVEVGLELRWRRRERER
jgi:hypothetical protein